MNRPICIIGPTACYKTETAVLLAEKLHGEIISDDSVQVYKELKIGSAKPSVEECRGIPYHLVDLIAPDDRSFSVQAFQVLANQCINDILSRNLRPIICGGSGLYVNALITPLNFAIPRDADIRSRIESSYDQSPERVYFMLQNIDPETAARLHMHDKKRIVRALEVFECSGKKLSEFGNQFQDGIDHPRSEICLIGLNMDRERLYSRINQRVDRMMGDGLLEEVQSLFEKYPDPSLPAMQAIGYRQFFPYFSGEISLETAVEQVKQETRRFAKRQLIWFRRNPNIQWFSMDNGPEPVIESIINTIEGK